jgi:hypothetical protein
VAQDEQFDVFRRPASDPDGHQLQGPPGQDVDHRPPHGHQGCPTTGGPLPSFGHPRRWVVWWWCCVVGLGGGVNVITWGREVGLVGGGNRWRRPWWVWVGSS